MSKPVWMPSCMIALVIIFHEQGVLEMMIWTLKNLIIVHGASKHGESVDLVAQSLDLGTLLRGNSLN